MYAAGETHLAKACPVMRRLIREHGPCSLEVNPRQPFEALVCAVAHQQLHGKAADSILRRFRAQYRSGRFPSPAVVLETPVEALRSCGFSQGKVLSIRDLAAKTLEGIVPGRAAALRLSDEELIERLTAVRGVGRWTVEMLLIFTLGRPDVFPSDDYGVRNGYRIAVKQDSLPAPRELRAAAEKWAPWRTLAAWYLWRAADNGGAARPLP